MEEIIEKLTEFAINHNIGWAMLLLSAASAAFVARAPFRTADQWLPDFVKERITSVVDVQLEKAERIGSTVRIAEIVLTTIFGNNPSSWRFFVRSAVLSLALVAVAGITYLAMIAIEYTTAAIQSDILKDFFLRIFTFGFLINVLVDYAILAYFTRTLRDLADEKTFRMQAWIVTRDLIYKVGMFTAAFITVYFYGLAYNGIGSVLAFETAVRTFLSGLQIKDMSSLYIYSAIFSSFWLIALIGATVVLGVLRKISRRSKLGAYLLPFESKPLLALGNVVGTIVFVLQLGITYILSR